MLLQRNSLITRIVIGKTIGLIVGLVGFVSLPYFSAGASELARWGVLLWYITFGAIIGVYGVITWHPVLRLPMPWWFRSSVIGAWLNFVVAFFTFETIGSSLAPGFGMTNFAGFAAAFALEGAIVGLIIGFVATRIGGEGAAIVDAERAG